MFRSYVRHLNKTDAILIVGGGLGFIIAMSISWLMAGAMGLIVACGTCVAVVLAISQLNLRKAYRQIDSLRTSLAERSVEIEKAAPVLDQMDLLLSEALLQPHSANIDSVKRARALRPTKVIPIDLIDKYTMHGTVEVQSWYFDDSQSAGKPVEFSTQMVEGFLERIARRESVAYGETCLWLYDALSTHNIKAMDVAIMGSVSPHFESVCLAFGGRPTTIEYSSICCRDPRLSAVTVESFWESPRVFDAAFSISSFEHDGLGRYGDPLNPDGDLQAMQNMKRIVKPGGCLYLAVPVGRDRLVWNAHRIYGPIRLPMLLDGWKVLDRFGWAEQNEEMYPGHSQPVLVLENLS